MMVEPDYIVASDGTGDFRTIQEAVDACDGKGLVAIRPGNYPEQVVLPSGTRQWYSFGWRGRNLLTRPQWFLGWLWRIWPRQKRD